MPGLQKSFLFQWFTIIAQLEMLKSGLSNKNDQCLMIVSPSYQWQSLSDREHVSVLFKTEFMLSPIFFMRNDYLLIIHILKYKWFF